MNEIKELFESVLVKYLSVTPGTTYDELAEKHAHWGICGCAYSCDTGNSLRWEAFVKLLSSQGIEPGTYYVTPPIVLAVIETHNPIGDYMYDNCIAPRIELLRKIISSL